MQNGFIHLSRAEVKADTAVRNVMVGITILLFSVQRCVGPTQKLPFLD